MKAVVQRVLSANLKVDGTLISEIDKGLVVFYGVGVGDTLEKADYLASKIAKLRIFHDENGKMNRSVLDVGGEILCVSQFTLYADTKKGNRPSFTNAMPGDAATKLYDLFNETWRGLGLKVKTGVFGADMQIGLTNDGPVTIIFEENAE